MNKLSRLIDEDKNSDILLVGTENKDVLFIDPVRFEVILALKLPSVPCMLSTSGCYDVDFRLWVATREAKVYLIRNKELMGIVIELESYPVSLIMVDNRLWIACNNKSLLC